MGSFFNYSFIPCLCQVKLFICLYTYYPQSSQQFCKVSISHSFVRATNIFMLSGCYDLGCELGGKNGTVKKQFKFPDLEVFFVVEGRDRQ